MFVVVTNTGWNPRCWRNWRNARLPLFCSSVISHACNLHDLPWCRVKEDSDQAEDSITETDGPVLEQHAPIPSHGAARPLSAASTVSAVSSEVRCCHDCWCCTSNALQAVLTSRFCRFATVTIAVSNFSYLFSCTCITTCDFVFCCMEHVFLWLFSDFTLFSPFYIDLRRYPFFWKWSCRSLVTYHGSGIKTWKKSSKIRQTELLKSDLCWLLFLFT